MILVGIGSNLAAPRFGRQPHLHRRLLEDRDENITLDGPAGNAKRRQRARRGLRHIQLFGKLDRRQAQLGRDHRQLDLFLKSVGHCGNRLAAAAEASNADLLHAVGEAASVCAEHLVQVVGLAVEGENIGRVGKSLGIGSHDRPDFIRFGNHPGVVTRHTGDAIGYRAVRLLRVADNARRRNMLKSMLLRSIRICRFACRTSGSSWRRSALDE